MRTPSNRTIVFILGTLSAVSPFSIDMYLPAFSLIAQDLHASPGRVALSLSSYFLALALGQLCYGPLLDRFGRKAPITVGLAVYLLASIGCMLAPNVEVLIALRFVQALGGCSAQVGAITMVRDFFPADQRAKVFSLLMLILGVAPLLAPTAGSLIAAHLGWRWVFTCLTLIVSCIFLGFFFVLPEGHQPNRSIRLRIGPIARTYWDIARNRQFATYALSGALAFSGLFTYVTGSPRIFMEHFGISVRNYGLIFALLATGFIGGSQVNIFLLRRHTSARIYRVILTLLPVIAIAFLVASTAGWLSTAGTIAMLFVYLSCVGIAGPNSGAIALGPFSANAGSASALLGFSQMGIGAAASTLLGILDIPGSVPVAAVFTGSAMLARAILWLGRRHAPAPASPAA